MGIETKKQKTINRLLERGAKLPRHVAIIMDGNGRWAKMRGLPRIAGHHEGIKSVRKVVEAAGEIGVKVLTLYTFSKENWYRPKQEVSTLMKLLVKTIRAETEDLMEKNVRLQAIGDLEDLPEFAYEELTYALERTRHNTGLILNLALSYSGRKEIIDAVREIGHRIKAGLLQPEEISEQVISAHLYTYDLPDPDLLIRTSGEVRISNFLLWQLAYTEIYVTKVLWPDFGKAEFFDALVDYLNRERRFGKVTEQVIHETG
ncbi:MAG: isoprenyl transferase [Calditrichia bacterium]